MSTFQKVTIIGNLGDDPHIHRFEGGNLMAQLSIATTESWKDKDGQKQSRTEWHKIIVNGDKRVEIIEKYCKKGDKILIEGKLKTRKWTDSSNVERYTTEIVCDDFKFMSTKTTSDQPANTPSQTQPDPNDHPGNDGEHDDLPF